MKTKSIIIAFAVVALIQLVIPAKMVYQNEIVYTEGTEYKFKTEPVDPSDPFRGKYIVLDFTADSATVNENRWTAEYGYVVLGKDKDGFAKVDTLLEYKPPKGDYVKVNVEYYTSGNIATIDYPFNRFYMEESKAPDAEILYREYNNDKNKVPAYAVVSVKGDVAVVKDVILGGMPIKKYVEKHRK